jgi:crotonobetainyl-CoA:carnitine CoA-transferase CaiB-like acyl-CoA transferase
MYAAIAVLAALNRRRDTGRGELIDISMLDCQAAMLSYQAAYFLHSGQVPGRQGTRHDSIPTYRAFTAGDGIEVVITANTEKMWQGLCRALGTEELVEDARFKTNRERFANRHELWPLLEQAFLKRPADAWVSLLEREQVPVGVVNTLDRVMSDPQIAHRGLVLTLEGEGKSARVMGDPMVFAHAGKPHPRYPSALGEDTESVLSDVLGLDAAEIARLRSAGAVPPAAQGGVPSRAAAPSA